MKLSKLEKKYFEEVTQLIAPSGTENEVAYYLKKEFEKLGFEYVKDNLGSIFAVKKSKIENAPKVMIVGHMDEVGFYVGRILENGMIHPTPVGGFNYNSLQAQRLLMINNEGKVLHGAIDTTPPHLMKGGEKVSADNLLFDFGFKSKEDALKANVNIGCPIVCEGRLEYTYDEEHIISKAIDDRYGIILGLLTLNEFKDVDLPFDLYVGGSVQEEVGTRGAVTSANLIKPDLAIVLDCSPARDSTGSKENGVLGEGVLIRYFDRSMIAFKKLLDLQIKACNEAGVKYQYFDSPGGTDAGQIHISNEGVLTLTHCICARSIHTSSTVMRIDDFIAAKKALFALLKMINKDLIEELKA